MSSKKKTKEVGVSATERALSALVGYTCGAVVVLPFDRIKSLMQVSEAARKQGAVRLARSVYAANGVRGLYKGGGPHMLIAPYTVFYYSIYDELLERGRAATAKNGNQGHALVPLAAAVCGRTLETTIRMPFELLRTMMQTSESSVTLGDCVRMQLKQPAHTWLRGYVPTLLRDVPFSAIYWLGYEETKSRVRLPESLVQSGTLRTALQSFLSGALAGIVAAIIVTPLDVIKTVRQHHVECGVAPKYSAILSTIRHSPAVAFAGIGPRLFRVPAGLATMMAGLEVTKWCFLRRGELQRAQENPAPSD